MNIYFTLRIFTLFDLNYQKVKQTTKHLPWYSSWGFNLKTPEMCSIIIYLLLYSTDKPSFTPSYLVCLFLLCWKLWTTDAAFYKGFQWFPWALRVVVALNSCVALQKATCEVLKEFLSHMPQPHQVYLVGWRFGVLSPEIPIQQIQYRTQEIVFLPHTVPGAWATTTYKKIEWIITSINSYFYTSILKNNECLIPPWPKTAVQLASSQNEV